jgi:hypothetical protein
MPALPMIRLEQTTRPSEKLLLILFFVLWFPGSILRHSTSAEKENDQEHVNDGHEEMN